MGKAKFYAVRKGRNTGVFKTWAECSNQVTKFAGAEYKAFNTHAEAVAFVKASGSKISTFTSRTSTPYTRNETPMISADVAPRLTVRTGLFQVHDNFGPRASYFDETGNDDGYDMPNNGPSRVNYTGKTYAPEQSRTMYKSTAESPIQEIYTDGSCLGNGKKAAFAGWGMYWGDARDAFGPIDKSTNNAGELTAISKALREILRSGSKGTTYIIFSDSEYSINGLTKWVHGWMKKNWKTSSGGDVQNADLFKDILSLLQTAKDRGYTVKIEKIKAHSNFHGNEMADRLAKKGAEMARDTPAGMYRH